MSRTRILFLVLLIFLLSACQIKAQPPTTSLPTDTPTSGDVVAGGSDSSATSTSLASSETPVEATLAASATATLAIPTNTPAPTATPAPVVYGPDKFPAGINPLTGLKVSESKLLERRPISIKIQLFPRGQRMPWGISLADLVYDYYQNNGLTRFNAIFYGNDAKQVGPIRSARLLDDAIIRMYKSFFLFGGADQRILTRLFNADYYPRLVIEGSNNCPPMCRIDPNGFNFLVTNTADLAKYAVDKKIDNTRQNLDGMSFNSEPPAGGTQTNQVLVHFSISAYARWDYDVSSGRYLRFQDNLEANSPTEETFVPLMDQLTNQQIAADNVVVLLFTHERTSSSSGNEIIEYQLSGSGTAYAYRDGQVYKLNWNRPSANSVLFLTFPDGKPYPFKPGNTWFEVMGLSSKIETKDAGVLRFVFGLP